MKLKPVAVLQLLLLNIYRAHENSADNRSMIISCKVIDRIFLFPLKHYPMVTVNQL